jgi:hypothetical protein
MSGLHAPHRASERHCYPLPLCYHFVYSSLPALRPGIVAHREGPTRLFQHELGLFLSTLEGSFGKLTGDVVHGTDSETRSWLCNTTHERTTRDSYLKKIHMVK